MRNPLPSLQARTSYAPSEEALAALRSGDVSALLASHRSRFGGWSMKEDDEDDEDEDDSDEDDDDGPENVKDSKGNDLGYPAKTKVKDMTVEQQAAYWKHNARSKDDQLRKVGDVKTLKEKAEAWDKHQEENADDVEKAKQAGRQEAASEANQKAVNAVLRVGLSARDLEDDEIANIVRVINPSAFIDAAGEVDTDALQDYIDQVAGPASRRDDEDDEEDDEDDRRSRRDRKRTKKWPDTGGGRRRGKKSSGVSAGADLYKQERAGKQSKSS